MCFTRSSFDVDSKARGIKPMIFRGGAYILLRFYFFHCRLSFLEGL